MSCCTFAMLKATTAVSSNVIESEIREDFMCEYRFEGNRFIKRNLNCTDRVAEAVEGVGDASGQANKTTPRAADITPSPNSITHPA